MNLPKHFRWLPDEATSSRLTAERPPVVLDGQAVLGPVCSARLCLQCLDHVRPSEVEALSEADQALLFGAAQTAMLLDDSPSFLFVVKDVQGRYVSFNTSLMCRLGVSRPEDLRDRLASAIWPADLARRFAEQDAWIRQHQQPLLHQLDPILLPDRRPGWCVTHKYPLHSGSGQLLGILCMSRDVMGVPRTAAEAGLILAADLMTKHSEQKLTVADLAALAGMGSARFSSLVRRIYGQSPMDFIVRNRVRAACMRLRAGKEALLDVALACGFYDQAQFSRQFKRVTGMVPSNYRQSVAQPHTGIWRWDGYLR